MKRSLKNLSILTLGASLLGLLISAPAMAWSHYGYHHDYHSHYYHRGGDQLAAGLVVGGLIGVMAGSAMANSGPVYTERYYSAPVTCYKEKVWSQRFCDHSGCYRKSAWRDVCN